MEGNKLDIVAKEKEPLTPPSKYKQIPEDDMEDKSSRPRSVVQESNGHEPDGADEKMLSNEETKVASNSKIDLTEVKFTSSEKNGDAKLDIENSTTNTSITVMDEIELPVAPASEEKSKNGVANGEVKSEFVGMTKEELMKCANEPFWVRLRWALFILFWLLWAGMLVGAILIIVAAPKCTPPQPKTWWEEGPITKIVDLKADIEAAAASNTGFILSVSKDAYVPLNNTPDLEAFLLANKERNLIVELNPSVSDRWFADSEAKNEHYANYYIWNGPEGVNNQEPNNWLAKSSTDDAKQPAWLYSNTRKQYYYAPDGKPQLNFRNPAVKEEFDSVLNNYLSAGVEGFMLKNVPGLLVDGGFADEALKGKSDVTLNHYNFYTHTKTENLEELQPIVNQWSAIIKNQTEPGVLMLSDELSTLKPYKNNGTLLIDLPKQRNVFGEKITATDLKKGIEAIENFLEHKWPAWQVDSTAYPEGTLEIVAYLLKGSTIFNKNFNITVDLKDARRSDSVLYGTQKLYTAANDTVFAYTRMYPGNPGYLVAFNPTDEEVVVDFPNDIPDIPEEVTVQHFSPTYKEEGVGLRLKKSSHDFPISAKSAIILSYVPKAAE